MIARKTKAKRLDALLTDVSENVRRAGKTDLAAQLLAYRGSSYDPRTHDDLARLISDAIAGDRR